MCNYYNKEVRQHKEPQEIQQEEGQNSALRNEQPYTQILLKDTQLERILGEKVAIKLNMKQQEPLQKRRPILPWGAWGKIFPEGQRTWSFHSTQNWQCYIWDAGSSFGLFSMKDVDILETSQQKAMKMLKALGYFIYDKSLRKLGLFSLEKRKLKKILSMYVNT